MGVKTFMQSMRSLWVNFAILSQLSVAMGC